MAVTTKKEISQRDREEQAAKTPRELAEEAFLPVRDQYDNRPVRANLAHRMKGVGWAILDLADAIRESKTQPVRVIRKWR